MLFRSFRLVDHEGDEVGHCSEEEDAGKDGSLDRQEEGGAQTAGSLVFLSLQRLRFFESLACLIITGVSFGSGHRTAGIFRGQGRPWGVCGVFSCDSGIFVKICVKVCAEDCFEGKF